MGDVVMSEGEISDRIFWILDGNCRCAKTVPLVLKKGPGGNEYGIYEKGQVLGPNEEVIQQSLDIQNFEQSDHFPGLTPDATNIKEIIDTDREKAGFMLRGYMGKEGEEDAAYVQYSVVATSRTEIASISKFDYIRFASMGMIQETIQQKNLYNVSIREVQEAFIEEQNWAKFKKMKK